MRLVEVIAVGAVVGQLDAEVELAAVDQPSGVVAVGIPRGAAVAAHEVAREGAHEVVVRADNIGDDEVHAASVEMDEVASYAVVGEGGVADDHTMVVVALVAGDVSSNGEEVEDTACSDSEPWDGEHVAEAGHHVGQADNNPAEVALVSFVGLDGLMDVADGHEVVVASVEGDADGSVDVLDGTACSDFGPWDGEHVAGVDLRAGRADNNLVVVALVTFVALDGQVDVSGVHGAVAVVAFVADDVDNNVVDTA